jgi:hypothetical protein
MDMIWSGHLVGTFYGYKPSRLYELSDGSKWTQTDLTDEPAYRDDPTARLVANGSGAIYLDVEGTCAIVAVHRIGHCPRPTSAVVWSTLLLSKHNIPICCFWSVRPVPAAKPWPRLPVRLLARL